MRGWSRFGLVMLALWLLLALPVVVMAQESAGETFQTNTPPATAEVVETVGETSPVVTQPVQTGEDYGISAAVVDGLFERLQNANQTVIIITLVVLAVIVIPAFVLLYRSVPPSAIKDQIGREILQGADRSLSGLQRLAAATPTDIDDYLIAKIRDKLKPQLQADIALAVDAKFNGTGAG